VEFTDVPYTQKHFISSKFFIAICSWNIFILFLKQRIFYLRIKIIFVHKISATTISAERCFVLNVQQVWTANVS
jgi:hypothetical protein